MMNGQNAMYTLVLAGNGPYANRGCEAIVRGTTAVLREQMPHVSFISNYFARIGGDDAAQEKDPDLIHQPIPWLKPLTISWFQEQVARRVLQQPIQGTAVAHTLKHSLPQAQGVLMLGGDNYTLDYGSHRIFFKINDIALAYPLPVAIWGASIGPFSQEPELERWAAKELRRVTLICARETETQSYLDMIGVRENVVLTADPAFHLNPEPVVLPDAIETFLTQSCIGLNLSPLLHRFMTTRPSRDTLAAWTEIAAQVVTVVCQQTQAPILLIPHVMSYTGEPERDDFVFLQTVARRVNRPDQVQVLGNTLNAAQTKWVIGRLRLFAGARTHSTLAAISSGVPTLCIGYSLKAQGIAQDVYGHGEWLIDNKVLMREPTLLAEKLQALAGAETSVRAHLQHMIPVFRDRVRETARLFWQLVG